MKNDNTIRYQQLLPDVHQALLKVNPAINATGLDHRLQHLVHLRASQINGCAFCVKMHTREAREDGETNERLDRLVVWRHVRSEEHTSELQSLMRISYAVFCLKKKNKTKI